MNTQPLSRDLALRIGLAARVLPGIEPRRLLDVLQESLGLPLTEGKLAKITVTELKTGFSSLDGEEDGEDVGEISVESYKQAVRYLWGEDLVEPELPQPQSYADGDMPNSVRIACASNSGEFVDGHFGSCHRFLIYQVSPDEMRLIDIRPTVGADQSDDKNAFRAGLIDDCHVVYIQSVGGPAAAKIIKAGIYPIKLPEGGIAPEVLTNFQTMLAGTPPPWLAKILGVEAEARVRFAAEN